MLEKNKKVTGMPKLDHINRLCEVSVIEKQHKKTFSK